MTTCRDYSLKESCTPIVKYDSAATINVVTHFDFDYTVM
jgi:hypothetical protein